MVSKINQRYYIGWISLNKWKGFSSHFFINNKRSRKKLYGEIHSISSHNFTVVPKYKNLFLHINLKLVLFAPNLPIHSLSLISILVGILWSSKSFVKYTLQNSLKIHKLRH